MADPDAYSLLFKRALAQHLASHGVGVYRTDGSDYLPAERGIYVNGPTLPLPTPLSPADDCVVLTWLSPIPDGRGDMLYRVQTLTRVKGNVNTAENAAAVVAAPLDQKQGVPFPDVSWCSLFSQLTFTPDSSGRASVAQTFHFLGRRH